MPSRPAGAFYAYLLTTVAAGLTSFYSWRLVFMTFFGTPHWAAGPDRRTHVPAHGHDDHDAHGRPWPHARRTRPCHALDPHESPLAMLIPLDVLAFGALFAGLVFRIISSAKAPRLLEGRALSTARQPYPRSDGGGAGARRAACRRS